MLRSVLISIVAELRKKRAALNAEAAVASRPTSTLGESIAETYANDLVEYTPVEEDRLLANLTSRHGEYIARSKVALHRLAGVTFFTPQNPNPVPEGEKAPIFVGIRFEHFSTATFSVPYYIILRDEVSTDLKTRIFRIHKHTVPAFIPLERIALDYLNNDFSAFIRVVRKWTTYHAYKHSIVAHLQEVEGVKVDTDESAHTVHVLHV
jgi:central kinetochore subunit Mal2/MCM21